MNFCSVSPLTPKSPLPRERGEGTCFLSPKCSASPALREKGLEVEAEKVHNTL